MRPEKLFIITQYQFFTKIPKGVGDYEETFPRADSFHRRFSFCYAENTDQNLTSSWQNDSYLQIGEVRQTYTINF